MTILIIDEVYEDLRDFLDGEFWDTGRALDENNDGNDS